jgi:hypothetical protein
MFGHCRPAIHLCADVIGRVAERGNTYSHVSPPKTSCSGLVITALGPVDLK